VKLSREHLAYVRKGLIALAGALGVLAVALTDDVVTKQEIIQVVLAGLAAVGVVVVPNGSAPKK
jgi:hypothetical protein